MYIQTCRFAESGEGPHENQTVRGEFGYDVATVVCLHPVKNCACGSFLRLIQNSRYPYQLYVDQGLQCLNDECSESFARSER